LRIAATMKILCSWISAAQIARDRHMTMSIFAKTMTATS